MAAFYPYDVEGYGATDDAHVTTLGSLDLRGRLAGDVLTEILYAAPDGTVNPAMYRGCQSRESREVNTDRLRGLGVSVNDPTRSYAEANLAAGHWGDGSHNNSAHPNPSRHAVPSSFPQLLVADARHTAKADVRAQNDRIRQQGPVLDSGPSVSRLAALAGSAPRYGASRVVPHVTRCECKPIQDRARMRSALKSTDNENYARFLKDFHGRDDRWFSDGDKLVYEFYDLANASTLAVSLTRAGVISPPPFPLPVLAGRDSPCACSLIGPELVHKIERLLLDDWERFSFARLPLSERNFGSALARYNARVAMHFDADDELQRRGDAFSARAHAMAGADSGAGSWEYQPLPSREPGRGRFNVVMDPEGGVSELRRAIAERTAATYGYTLGPGGQLMQ